MLKLLFEYCKTDNIEALQLYFSNNYIEVNEKDENGWSMLSVSVFHHSYNCIDFLLSKGADINSKNKNGTTILMYAKTKVLENGNFEFLDFLISKGADPFIKDNFGKTILDYVVEIGDFQMINYFKDKLNKK